MTRKCVNTLILDLDNTIFDWFAVWYGSFRPIYDAILAISGRPPEEIEADIRRVHQMRRTSEYSFLIEEIDVLKEVRAKQDIRNLFKDALQLSQHARDQNLKMYPSVFRSLWNIKRKRTKIVAYTESMRFYSAYRLKRLGLDGVIDVLFSPDDHDMPAGVSVDKIRRLPNDFYELQVTEVRHTPPGELKPNPLVLQDIIQAVGAKADLCAYVGDSLFKDAAMARRAGVFDIHAQYGESQRRPEYSLLQRVSHWTEEDVQREKTIIDKGNDFVPYAVLKESFAEIFMYCDFDAYSAIAKKVDTEQETKNAIEIWKKCVDVHQHFNDLEMRTRNLAITVVGTLIAAVSFTYKEGLEIKIFEHVIPAALGLVAAAVFAWGGFFLMDRYWYHVLLKGAVEHSNKVEKQFSNTIPGIGLGTSISEASSELHIFGIKMNSERRLLIFYSLGVLILVSLFAFLLFATPNRIPASSETPVSRPTQDLRQDASLRGNFSLLGEALQFPWERDCG